MGFSFGIIEVGIVVGVVILLLVVVIAGVTRKNTRD